MNLTDFTECSFDEAFNVLFVGSAESIESTLKVLTCVDDVLDGQCFKSAKVECVIEDHTSRSDWCLRIPEVNDASRCSSYVWSQV